MHKSNSNLGTTRSPIYSGCGRLKKRSAGLEGHVAYRAGWPFEGFHDVRRGVVPPLLSLGLPSSLRRGAHRRALACSTSRRSARSVSRSRRDRRAGRSCAAAPRQRARGGAACGAPCWAGRRRSPRRALSRHQQSTLSLRATATAATWRPRRAAMRAAKACSGPGLAAAIQAASTSTWRAAAEPCLESRPW